MFATSGIVRGSLDLEVQLPAIALDTFKLGGGGTYSGIRFGSDGVIYKKTAAGAWQSAGLSWLLEGNASDYYLERTVQGPASLNTDSGNLQQMNAFLDFDIYLPGFGVKTCDILFSICDDTLGANELVTRTYTLKAESEP